MTYLFSSSQISRGRGYFGRSAASSLAMMSLHSATHSSQMKTRGPEISLRTSRRRFPQNEQWKSSIKEEYCTRSAPRQAPIARKLDAVLLTVPVDSLDPERSSSRSKQHLDI